MKDPENGKIIDIIEGWKVKQYLNKRVDRYYVTISQNSPLARKLGRHRLLRSHFVWMRANDTWEIPYGCVVHHEDHDRHNDTLKNLKLMTSIDHDRLHRELAAINGATRFRGRRHSEETKARMRKIAQARGNNEIWDCPKTHHTDNTKALMSKKASGKFNPTYRSDLDPEEITAFYKKCRSLAETARRFNCSHSAIRYRLDPEIYRLKKNPLAGRERTYRFDDVEMFAFYKENGARKAAEKYGCTVATIYYRIKALKNEDNILQAAQ